jgi:hypothetical protein
LHPFSYGECLGNEGAVLFPTFSLPEELGSLESGSPRNYAASARRSTLALDISLHRLIFSRNAGNKNFVALELHHLGNLENNIGH